VQGFAFIIPNQTIPAGINGLKAADCGDCHQTIYMEWKNSTHASALRDIQFQSDTNTGNLRAPFQGPAFLEIPYDFNRGLVFVFSEIA